MPSRNKQLVFIVFELLMIQDLMPGSNSMLEEMEKANSLSLYHGGASESRLAFDFQRSSTPYSVGNSSPKNLKDYPAPNLDLRLGAPMESSSSEAKFKATQPWDSGGKSNYFTPLHPLQPNKVSPHPRFKNSSPTQVWENYNSLLSKVSEPASNVLIPPPTVKKPFHDERLRLYSNPQRFKQFIRKKPNLPLEFISEQENLSQSSNFVGSKMRKVVQTQNPQTTQVSTNLNFGNTLPTHNTHPAGDYSLQKFNLNPVAKGLEPHIENPPETIGDNFHEILLKKQPWRPEGLSIKKQENHVTPSSYTSDPSHGITSLDRETPLQETDLLKPKNSMFDPVKTMTGQIGDSNSYLQRKDSIRVFGKDIEILPGNKINGEQGRSPIKSGLADAQKSADPNAQESPDSFKLMGKKIQIPSPSAQNINREIKSHLTIPSVEGDLGSAKTILPNQEFRSPQNPKSPIISQPTHPLVPEAFPPGSTVGKEKNPAMDNGKSRVQNDQKTSVPQHGTQADRPPNPEEFTEDIFNSFRNSKHASKSNELPPRKRKARMNSVIQSNVVKPTEFSKAELEAAEGLEKLTSGIQLGPQPGTKIKEPIGVSKAEENFDVAPSTSSQHFSKDNYKNPVTFENDPLHSNFDTMQSEKATNIKSNVITQHKEKIPHGEAHEESPNLNNGVGDLENLSWSSKRLRSIPTHQMEEGNNNVLAKLYNIKMSSNNIRDLDRPLKYYLKVKQDGAEASASSKLRYKKKITFLNKNIKEKLKKINSMPSTPEEYGQSRKSPILID